MMLFENGSGDVDPAESFQIYLMEFDFQLDGDVMAERLWPVLESGRIPVIAHPERYACIQYRPDMLYQFMKQDAWHR